MSDLRRRLANQRIGTAWRGYAEKALPEDAGPAQERETRRAFYSGTKAMFTLLALEGEIDLDNRLIESIQDELDRFARDMEAGLV